MRVLPHGTAWAWSNFADTPDVHLSLSSDFRYYRKDGCFTVSSDAGDNGNPNPVRVLDLSRIRA